MGMCSEDRIHSLQVCQTSYQSKCKKANPSEQLQRSNIKLATVRRGPRPPEITQLIAEHRIQHGISNANNIKCNVSKELMQSDEDDDDNNISSCSHDTPSRVPLICRSTIVTSHDANRTISNNIVSQSSRVTSSSLNSLVPLAVIALVLAFYIALGACIFSLWEDWSLLDGAYFCFVTLTTIGFGDILPLRSLNGNQLQLVACCGYLLVGLVLIAMAFSLVQSQIMLRCAISNERCFKH